MCVYVHCSACEFAQTHPLCRHTFASNQEKKTDWGRLLKKKTRTELRQELVNFYTRFGIVYEDKKIGKALDKFKGKEGQMFESLYKKYDTEIKRRRTALMLAAQQGHEAAVAVLLKAEGIDANAKDNDG